MSQKQPTEPTANLSNLAEQARQAYEQKRTKDCLDLTRAMLLIDPDNADAQWMRSSVQSAIQRDLEDAQELLRQAHARENAEAQPQSGAPSDSPGVPLEPDRGEVEAVESVPPARSWRTRWLLRAAALVILAFGVGSLLRVGLKSNPVEASLNAADRTRQTVNSNAAPTAPAVQAAADVEFPILPLIPPSAPAPPVSDPAESRTPADQVSVPATASPRPAAKPPVDTVAARGILAVSSPTAVDIFKDDAYIGSAPVSFELPAGTYTLEYRHGDMRRFLTHIINGNETTKAMVTFDITVQINSKPWSEVFIDGSERKALGQTPLSGVRVPIGSVLVFENAKSQTKRYRVTGNETGIQIVFP